MLKSLVIAAAVVTTFAPSAQALEFVNADGSKFSQLCIAAAQSSEGLKREAANLGITLTKAAQVQCNGMSITEFAKQYSKTEESQSVRVYAFENANNAPESELCIAAATSNETFEATKARLFAKNVVRNVTCNGLEMAKFARKYNKSFNG